MIMLKKANRINLIKVRVKTMRILLLENETKRRIADALKRQSERIFQ